MLFGWQENSMAKKTVKKTLQTLKFTQEPTFAELWDACVHHLLYKVTSYTKELETFLRKKSITKESRIIDVSSGGGFPALQLLQDGYQVDCMDAFQDEVELFQKKAKALGLKTRAVQAYWKEIPKIYPKEAYDLVLCRGNSFIYAGGGWNELVKINKRKALRAYSDTLKDFYRLLKVGGSIYIDKFKDSEKTHRETVARLRIVNRPEQTLIFWTERFPTQKIRRASMIRRDSEGEEQGIPNITYDLSEFELREMMKLVGFKGVKRLHMKGEKHFSILIGQK